MPANSHFVCPPLDAKGDGFIQKTHMSAEELAAINDHWQKRALWAENEVEQLRQLVTLWEQAWDIRCNEERERCAKIAAARPHHSGLEIAELIRDAAT